MKFNWTKFSEADYKNYLAKCKAGIFNGHYLIGLVYVGDIRIELVDDDDCCCDHDIIDCSGIFYKWLAFNFYVAHEDTGYGYTDNGLPYDRADGLKMDVPYGLSYEQFKGKAESAVADYINTYNKNWSWGGGNYTLLEHANRPLEVW